MSIIGDLLDQLKKIVADSVEAVLEGAASTLALVETILNLKAFVQNEFREIEAEVKKIYDDIREAEDRFKHLKSKVIRADLVFKLVKEIANGELKKFLTDSLGKIKHSSLEGFDHLIEGTKEAGFLKSTSAGGLKGAIQKFISLLHGAVRIWLKIAVIVEALRQVLPVLKEIHKKILEIENIIMSQKKPVHYISQAQFRSRRIVPPLNIETDRPGTRRQLNFAIGNIRELQAENASLKEELAQFLGGH